MGQSSQQEGESLLYVLSGQDDFSLAQSLEEMKREIGDQASLAPNITTLEGRQVTLDQLRVVAEAAPFLAGRRLVIIRGLLERFEPGRRTVPRPRSGGGRAVDGVIPRPVTAPVPERSSSSRSPSRQPDDYKPFGSYLTQIPGSTVVVLVENGIAGNNPLFRELANKAVVRSFPLLREKRLLEWVRERVKGEGGSMSPRAVELLARLVGGNLWIMASEINKLVLFVAGRCIEEEDVKTVVSYAQPTSVFAMVDAIVEFKVELAEQLLEQLLHRGAPPAYLLTMLSRQVRLIVRARELRNQGKSPTEIQGKLGLPEFAGRKTLEQASRYSWSRLREVYHRLLEADLAIKTGKYDGELALNILVAELCQSGRSSVAGAKPGLN